MKVEINVERFLNNIKNTKYDYTYYLITHELERLKITERIGELRPEHMNPILLFLRDWMPSGWVSWSEKKGRWWQMGSELCKVLNGLRNEFLKLRDLDLEHFEPDRHGNAVKRIFECIYELKPAVSEEAIATVASKVMHLLKPKLFVMWDTKIIGFYKCPPNAEGYLEFLVEMKKLAGQLQSHLNRIKEKAEELRKVAGEAYGMELCSEKSLAKLIDEYNWYQSRR